MFHLFILFFGGGSVLEGRRIEQFLKNAGIDAQYVDDIERVLWEKYLFVSPFANATTVLGCPIRAVADSAEGKELVQNLIGEILALATVKGIDLPDHVVKETFSTAQSFPKEAKTSMQLDYEKGRRMETETLTEYVLTESCRYGLKAPVHKEVLDKLTSHT